MMESALITLALMQLKPLWRSERLLLPLLLWLLMMCWMARASLVLLMWLMLLLLTIKPQPRRQLLLLMMCWMARASMVLKVCALIDRSIDLLIFS
jgi:hypothetical protein